MYIPSIICSRSESYCNSQHGVMCMIRSHCPFASFFTSYPLFRLSCTLSLFIHPLSRLSFTLSLLYLTFFIGRHCRKNISVESVSSWHVQEIPHIPSRGWGAAGGGKNISASGSSVLIFGMAYAALYQRRDPSSSILLFFSVALITFFEQP